MKIPPYRKAISEALRQEMQRDRRVVLIGQDIGLGGGAFGITKGFLKEFGKERVIDAPLTESGFIGAALGMAMMGLHPVAELQYSDFVTNAFKMLVDYAANHYYHHQVNVPVTVRLPAGALNSSSAFHSHNPEGWFFHVPGLKIVAAASPGDVKGLLPAAIRDSNPVLFLEYKRLYNLPLHHFPEPLREEVPKEPGGLSLGKGRVIREGEDLTLVTYGSTVLESLEAAALAAEEDGLEVEVIDLRSIRPFDKELILESVGKTGRALMVHEDHLTGGVGAELAAFVAREAFESLDAPLLRVGSLDTPIPFHPALEKTFLPTTEKILAAVRRLAEY
ncbi:MAG: alpha-ketoacid dehydrogenase subunit beta [Candidatus Tectomicrobia bacterium]|nr:alpha-ketoacid dehydrogenase subunit beta [Candidatus Tectomicrobia bacterium]